MKQAKRHYKIATLFSGAGGLDTGFTKTGVFENQIANDILEAPAETYTNYRKDEICNIIIQTVKEFNENPKTPCYIVGDVTEVDFRPLKEIDCIIGGPPCQDFSLVRGSRKDLGLKMMRGKLYSHFIRALTRVEPKVFVFENVPGLRSSNGGVAYKTITDDFENLNVRWSEIKHKINEGPEKAKSYFLVYNNVVDSSAIGIPQKRKRLIIIGARKDFINESEQKEFSETASKILEGGESLLSKFPLTAMEAFEGKTVPELDGKYREVMEEYRGIENEVGTEEAYGWKSKTWDRLTMNAEDDYIIANAIKPKDDEEIKVAFEEHKRVLKEMGYYGNSLSGKKFKDGSNQVPKESDSVKGRMEHTPPDMNYLFVNGTEWKVKGTMSNIYRRSHPLKPAYTVMAYGGGGTWSYHYEKGRGMLTNRERARLQTFPDDYMFEGNRSQVRTQIGEAVPVRLGTKLAEVTQMILEKNVK